MVPALSKRRRTLLVLSLLATAALSSGVVADVKEPLSVLVSGFARGARTHARSLARSGFSHARAGRAVLLRAWAVEF